MGRFGLDVRVWRLRRRRVGADRRAVRLGAGAARGARRPPRGRCTTSPRARRPRRAAGARCGCSSRAEFALAALLLVCGGLLLRAYDRVRHVDPGFRTGSRADLRGSRCPRRPTRTMRSGSPSGIGWQARLRRAAGRRSRRRSITCPPLGCHWGNFFEVEGGRRARRTTPIRSCCTASPAPTTSRRWASG